MRSPRWHVVVPFKDGRVAKSRLALGPDVRREVALAMVRDTVDQLLRVPAVTAVLVVCEQPDDVAGLGALSRVDVVTDTRRGLNEAIRLGEASARSREANVWVAACPADLPALDPAELGQVLDECAEQPRSVLADRQGTGTTLLVASPETPLDPRFGAASFQEHVTSGARAIGLDTSSSLRHDIDLVSDLEFVAARAPGSRTAHLAMTLLG